MPRRKQAEDPPKFPSLVCGACEFCRKGKGTEYLCWVDSPQFSHVDDIDGPQHFPRGAKVDPNNPRCGKFEARMHA